MKSSFYGINNNFSAGNDRFQFTYKAGELIPVAQRLRKEARQKIAELRANLERHTADSSISKASSLFTELKGEIKSQTRLVETFSLMIAGFKRDVNKELLLNMDDMAFLELGDEESDV